MYLEIEKVVGREILDSRGNPTVEAEVYLLDGTVLINDGKNLKIENSNLNLNEIIENYTNLENNNLDLSMFIDEYKNSNESNYEEKDDEIIMKVKNDKENIYVKEKILYINKKTYKPVKLEIKDNKQKERIYILYNEVEINV